MVVDDDPDDPPVDEPDPCPDDPAPDPAPLCAPYSSSAPPADSPGVPPPGCARLSWSLPLGSAAPDVLLADPDDPARLAPLVRALDPLAPTWPPESDPAEPRPDLPAGPEVGGAPEVTGALDDPEPGAALSDPADSPTTLPAPARPEEPELAEPLGAAPLLVDGALVVVGSVDGPL